jgi:hypothetical protein
MFQEMITLNLIAINAIIQTARENIKINQCNIISETVYKMSKLYCSENFMRLR